MKVRANVHNSLFVFTKRKHLLQPQQFALLLLCALLLNSEPLACLLHCSVLGSSSAEQPGMHAHHTTQEVMPLVKATEPSELNIAWSVFLGNNQPSNHQQLPDAQQAHEHLATLLNILMFLLSVAFVAFIVPPRMTVLWRRHSPPLPPPISLLSVL